MSTQRLTPEEYARARKVEEYLRTIFAPGDLIEVRGLKTRYGTVRHLSSDLHALAKTALLCEQLGGDVYYALNPISPTSKYAQYHTGKAMPSVTTTAGDLDIAIRANYMLDFDPVRPTGTAATTAQREASLAKARVVASALSDLGWPEPTIVDSGNGTHLLYVADRCPAQSPVWRDALAYLSRVHSDAEVVVDTKVHNAARIDRMPHTRNRKADRLAGIISTPGTFQPVTEAMLGALTAYEDAPEAGIARTRPKAMTSAREIIIDRVGVEELCAEYPGLLDIASVEERSDDTWFHLEICPFAGRAHKGQPGRSAIAVGPGRLSYHCYSDGCAGKSMGDLRRLLTERTGRAPSMPFWREAAPISVDQMEAMWGCEIDEGDDDDEPPTPPTPPTPNHKLYIDFETRSDVDLKVVGLDNYVLHESTRALLIAFAFDADPVQVVDLTVTGETLPSDVLAALTNPNVTKVAWNVAFELAILRARFGVALDLKQCYDPMSHARYLTLPGSLEKCAEALDLPVLKDKRGKQLIKMFSSPTKATKKMLEAGSPPTYWRDALTNPTQWQEFIDYCGRDVETMIAATTALDSLAPWPDAERKLWRLDVVINDRGLPVDNLYVSNATTIMSVADEATLAQLKTLTGLANPNSIVQLKKWLADQGLDMPSLAEESVEAALAIDSLSEEIRLALILRQRQSGAGPKKLAAFANMTSSDGRLRNQFAYYGATTGRWTGRGVQPQNLPKPSAAAAEMIDAITDAIRAGSNIPDFDVADAVTSTIRSAVRPVDGKHLITADYASIESRILAWLAGCGLLLTIYHDGLDAYKAFASSISGKEYEAITKQERTNAKPAVLGCGFGMSGRRLAAYAASMGIAMTEEEAAQHVQAFRTVYKEIPALWVETEQLAHQAVIERSRVRSIAGLEFDGTDPRFLAIRLPSGRWLFYLAPAVERVSKPWGVTPTLTFLASTVAGMRREDTYGARLVENIVQGIARDILADGLLRTTRAGYRVIGHVHDEIITEHNVEESYNKDHLEHLMSTPPSWAVDLPLAAEGAEQTFYRK